MNKKQLQDRCETYASQLNVLDFMLRESNNTTMEDVRQWLTKTFELLNDNLQLQLNDWDKTHYKELNLFDEVE